MVWYLQIHHHFFVQINKGVQINDVAKTPFTNAQIIAKTSILV